ADARRTGRAARRQGRDSAVVRGPAGRGDPDAPRAPRAPPRKDVSRGAAARGVAAARRPGVLIVPAQRRMYPSGALLGPLLGFVGVGTPDDMRRWPDLPLGAPVGRAGLERQYDAILRGSDGQQCVYVSPAG